MHSESLIHGKRPSFVYREEFSIAYQRSMIQERREIETLYLLVRALRPRTVIEIGSAWGGTTYLWTTIPSVEKVIAVDLAGEAGSPIADAYYVSCRDLMRTNPKITLIESNSHDGETVLRVREHLAGQPCDFLFIDGDHSLEAVSKDYSLYSVFVGTPGIIAFHDILPPCEVSQFWKKLEGDKLSLVAGSYSPQLGHDWAGIGVLFNLDSVVTRSENP